MHYKFFLSISFLTLLISNQAVGMLHAGNTNGRCVNSPELTELEIAALNKNEPLCESLLQKGAQLNIEGKYRPPLFLCKTKKLAQLFLTYNANIRIRDYFGKTYLHQVMEDPEYEPALIPFCKQQGLSPFDRDFFMKSPLHSIVCMATCVELQVAQKVVLLFDGLSHSQIQNLILEGTDKGESVLDILESHKRKFVQNPLNITLLESLLLAYLRKGNA